MNLNVIDGNLLKELLIAGGHSLGMHKSEVDSLNVFPVPDGDTGTNMNLTMTSAVNEVKKVTDNKASSMVKALSLGSLMGARGNSGVILSQLFRGFSKVLEKKDTFTPVDFANGLNEGVKTAYKAVLKPVEGTILTVSKGAAKAALIEAQKGGNLVEVIEKALEQGEKTLKQTPEMLPVLKQAGVVDAGGKGLLVIYEGWLKYLKGEEITYTKTDENFESFVDEHPTDPKDIEFAYCTEFIITGNNLDPDKVRDDLIKFGLSDSLLSVGTDEMVKVHVHTNNPGKALEYGVGLGNLQGIKIDNMLIQSENFGKDKEEIKGPQKDVGVVAVASGEGLKNIMMSMGVDHVIEGGQTMNPSTEDFLKAIEKVNAKSIILLPNNSNIILAAEQAEKIAPIPVKVVRSKTIPQGIAALLNYQSEGIDLEQLHSVMQDAISSVKSGQVTFAVRDSKYDNLDIKEGNILGIAENKIEVIGENVTDTTLELLEKLINDDSEIVTLFSGVEVTTEQGEQLVEIISEKFDHVEVELHSGGQPLYYYLISVE
ncbi:DAK2 domain-containing protein [Alkalicella caledoniensis]|uniref:DAK2 domain-containing protein n=1 Tax=Alkalicella caledoniensis TaxID=2731377 RepID=A0A7G9WCE7_ALKCA|nr:DAK2 domain-containing protein [Alkalicella caledoniensis]QNO16359.1 DAK2 domain-containing protein [Alkalicella caledoniensis]